MNWKRIIPALLLLSFILIVSPIASSQESNFPSWYFHGFVKMDSKETSAELGILEEHVFNFSVWGESHWILTPFLFPGVRETINPVGSSTFPWMLIKVELSVVNITGSGWSAYVYPSWFYLTGQTEENPKEAKLIVYAGTNPSFQADITVQAKMLFVGEWYKNMTFTVKAKQFQALRMNFQEKLFNCKQDEILHIPITLTNEGNYVDHFALDVGSAPNDWSFAFSPPTVIIKPHSTAETTLTVYIPHERIYIRHESNLIQVRAKSMSNPSVFRERWVVVNVRGFHLTPGQFVGVIIGTPPPIILIAALIVSQWMKSPRYYVPKPWREEKDELKKLDGKEKERVKELMKEERLSAINWCEAKKDRKKKIKKLDKEKEKMQNGANARMEREWKSLMKPFDNLRERRAKIKRDYEKEKEKTLNNWKEEIEEMEREYGKINERRKEHGLDALSIPEFSPPRIPELRLPEIKIPQRPLPPRYEIDEENMRVMKSGMKEERGKKIKIPRKERNEIERVKREKMEGIARIEREKRNAELYAMSKKMDIEMKKVEERWQIEKQRMERERKRRRDIAKLRIERMKVMEKEREEREKEKEEMERLKERMEKEKEREKTRRKRKIEKIRAKTE